MDTLHTQNEGVAGGRSLPFRLGDLMSGERADRAGLEADIARAAGLGFDAVLLPCPFDMRDGLIWDQTREDAAYGGGAFGASGSWLAERRRASGLALIVDLPLDDVAAGGPLHHALSDIYAAPDRSGVCDPRKPLDLRRARLRIEDEGAVASYLRLVADTVAQLTNGAFDGARLRNIARLPSELAVRVITAIRAAAPGAILVGDTTGSAWETLRALPSGPLDYVVASSAWWNWQDPWFFDELALLRRIAPPLLPASRLAERAATESVGAIFARDLGLAASIGAGWIVSVADAGAVFETNIRALNASFADDALARSLGAGASLFHLNGEHARVRAVLRTACPDPRAAREAFISLLNTDVNSASSIDPASFLPAAQDMFETYAPLFPGSGETLRAGRKVTLSPGELRVFAASRKVPRKTAPIAPESAAQAARAWTRLAIEAPSPAVDDGAFPVKRIAGELVSVACDIIGDGHDKLAARVEWRGPGSDEWEDSPLVPVGNDRWQGSFPLTVVGLHSWRIVAWRDAFATFRDELAKKHEAGVPIALELREGEALVAETLAGRPEGAALLEELGRTDDADEKRVLLLSARMNEAMTRADPRPHAVRSTTLEVDAERSGAGFAAWYEVFPRSLSDDPSRHGTFRDVVRHLPRIRDMGFDVLYFPPIHPIGRTNRKGPNNTLTPGPDDPGSPYAIGAAEGGHEALHPELGSFEDFRFLREQAALHGLEIALDFAIQCSPDHPWLRAHKGWFTWRPDGTIRYAENPPKKYQDIVNVDFYARDAIPGLWVELAQIVMFWCEQGVRLFRVDNPHTKAFPFWQWMIREVRARHPDAVFLAEAFTRPKIMARLAKLGFSQSYTYFTWRNGKQELRDYLTELADGPLRDFFRPHFFVNTPDINPFFLQDSGRPGFLIRAALAATLSGLWGVYNGFELCEGTPLAPGKEEYLDSEKFQLRAWDWDRPGNIAAEIATLNRIRRANPALRSHLGISFLDAPNEAILWFEKATPDRSNVLLIGISLDPRQAQSSTIEIPLWKFGLADNASLGVEDLVERRRFGLTGKYQHLELTPERPYVIWRIDAIS